MEIKKIEKIENSEIAYYIIELMEEIYRNSFKRMMILDEIFEIVNIKKK